jgi:hypothetical protein
MKMDATRIFKELDDSLGWKSLVIIDKINSNSVRTVSPVVYNKFEL